MTDPVPDAAQNVLAGAPAYTILTTYRALVVAFAVTFVGWLAAGAVRASNE